MATTIQISKDLQQEMVERKLFDNETYEEVIWNLIEDVMEISEETMKGLRLAEKDVEEGRIHSLSDVKRELNV